MFPWEQLQVSRALQEKLRILTEWQGVHTELVDEEKLDGILRFVEENHFDLHLITDRKGQVLGAFAGEIDEQILIEWDEIRPTNGKVLSGLRWLFFGQSIHIKNLSLLEKYLFARYGFDLYVKADVESEEAVLYFPEVENGRLNRQEMMDDGYSFHSLIQFDPTNRIQEIESKLKEVITHQVEERRKEKALLIGLELTRTKGKGHYTLDESLAELERLTDTAGAEVVGIVTQTRETPQPAMYLGEGKVLELKYQVYLEQIDLLIFDDELTPAQQRNLEQIMPVKIVDRSRLILDIFAQHAQTREGKLQVELAQMKYMLPRLMGMGTQLSRLGGGIGTRGPGETKLEVDRRRIRKRIQDLEREIKEVAELRKLHHQGRKLPVIALVGYTNAGKSTLLNQLTRADVLAENKLFATLDPTMRKLELGSSSVLLSDTVGFIQKLPHHLVAAFRATLEEVQRADLLLHVVDASHLERDLQMRTVLDVLGDLEVLTKPMITVFNKVDLIDANESQYLEERIQPSTVISAITGEGVEELLDLIRREVEKDFLEIAIVLPYDQGSWVEKLHRMGNVVKEEYRNEGIYLEVKVEPSLVGQLQRYVIEDF